MKIDRLKSQLTTLYKFFIAPPKEWNLPKQSEVMIYDACGAEVLTPYLTNYSVAILPVRGESINIPCLLRAIAKLKFWKGKLLIAYTEAFVQTVSPKLVITFIDNNRAFYRLSHIFPDTKTIFLQNGTRGESGDVFDNLVRLDDYHVDYMLVHGAAIGKHYLKYLSGKYIPIGSLKNNAVSVSTGLNSDTILFISQYHNKPNGIEAFLIDQDGSPVYWDEFFASEASVLKFLDRWCAENCKRLQICGRQEDVYGHERMYYADHLKECDWEYIPRQGNYYSYRLVDAAQIVVTIDSTLGYESIGRGKKTANLSCRMNNQNKNLFRFGWPADFPENGPFWTNEADETQFKRVMDTLNTASAEEWGLMRIQYCSELMEFDPGNSRFIALLDQLLPKLVTSKNA